jgi:hypothetical protein
MPAGAPRGVFVGLGYRELAGDGLWALWIGTGNAR